MNYRTIILLLHYNYKITTSQHYNIMKNTYYHSGYIESSHKKNKSYSSTFKNDFSKNAQKKEYYDTLIKFVNKEFVPCGNSGGEIWVMNGKKELRLVKLKDSNIITCTYCTGKCCDDEKIVRRWSCCKNGITGTLDDMRYVSCLT